MTRRIALYHDQASGERYEEKAFKKTGVRYEKIGPKDMIKDILARYDVVFLPGAFPLKTHDKGGFFEFLDFLRRMVRVYRDPLLDYVRSGGGLIAVCASSGIVGRSIKVPLYARPFAWGIKPLGLFDFDAVYGPRTGIVDLEPVDYDRPPEARNVVAEVLGEYSGDRFSSLYFRGPAITYGSNNVIHPSLKKEEKPPDEMIVATYSDDDPRLNGKGAIAYKEYGEGKAISCSVHPEFSTWDLFDSMIETVTRK
ncbi:MAG: hypothetical protein QCI82_06950 [Candidatus Thermoplasmatota archaeon]|nr:hypothetical protein [Candidatus Thermoplasmatota archaeon]